MEANRNTNEHDSIHYYRHYSGPIVNIDKNIGIAGGTTFSTRINKIFLHADLHQRKDKRETNSKEEK